MCLRERKPLPDFIRNAPELHPGLELYLEAFWELNSCRQLGMDIGPVPWTAIAKYGRMLFDSVEDIEEFHFLIREMDNAFLTWRAGKHKELPK